MFSLSRPDRAQIDAFLTECRSDSFSYPEVGATLDHTPPGYNIDHNRVRVGHGDADFEYAKTAIRQWKMFEVPGLELCYPDTPIDPGRNVAPVARHLGFYSMNSCRIVYVIDEPHRYGFAYGTLSRHAETGEERFIVESEPETGDVWYDVLAFSRPAHILVKLGYPYSRYRQKKFGSSSKAAMLRAVASMRDKVTGK